MSLEELVLAATPVADTSPQTGLSRLRLLQLQHTRFSDVGPQPGGRLPPGAQATTSSINYSSPRRHAVMPLILEIGHIQIVDHRQPATWAADQIELYPLSTQAGP